MEGIAHARHIGHGVQRAHLVVVDVAHRAAVGLGLGPGDGVIDPAGVVLHLLGEGQMVDEMGDGAGGGVVVIVAVVMVMVMVMMFVCMISRISVTSMDVGMLMILLVAMFVIMLMAFFMTVFVMMLMVSLVAMFVAVIMSMVMIVVIMAMIVTMKVFHIMIMVFMLSIQNDIKITAIKPRFAYAGDLNPITA